MASNIKYWYSTGRGDVQQRRWINHRAEVCSGSYIINDETEVKPQDITTRTSHMLTVCFQNKGLFSKCVNTLLTWHQHSTEHLVARRWHRTFLSGCHTPRPDMASSHCSAASTLLPLSRGFCHAASPTSPPPPLFLCLPDLAWHADNAEF